MRDTNYPKRHQPYEARLAEPQSPFTITSGEGASGTTLPSPPRRRRKCTGASLDVGSQPGTLRRRTAIALLTLALLLVVGLVHLAQRRGGLQLRRRLARVELHVSVEPILDPLPQSTVCTHDRNALLQGGEEIRHASPQRGDLRRRELKLVLVLELCGAGEAAVAAVVKVPWPFELLSGAGLLLMARQACARCKE